MILRTLQLQKSSNIITRYSAGNILSMPHLSSMAWDEKDQLFSAKNSTFTSYYNYDVQGVRTRKVVEKENIVETRYYIGGYEVFRKETNNTTDFERTTLNISDDEKVFVRIEKKTGENEVVRYQYDNHLGSACLELDESGKIISYEEYHPFGTTSYRSGRNETEVSQKRYKYCRKERDEETGLYYYGMRYYAAWICRFVSVDPLQFKYPELTPFQYASNRPITMIDLDGEEGVIRPTTYYRRNLNRTSRPTNYAMDANGRPFPSTRTITTTASTYVRNNTSQYGQSTIVSEAQPQYVTDYKAIPEGATVQMTRNNFLGKISTLMGEKLYVELQKTEDRLNTEKGLINSETQYTSIKFSNYQSQIKFNQLQKEYNIIYNQLINSMEDIEIPNSEYMIPEVKDLYQRAAKATKAREILGDSPDTILRSLIETEFTKTGTKTTSVKVDIHEFRSAD